MPKRGKAKVGEISIREMEDLYKHGDEELRGFIIKKAEEQGIKQDHFLKRLKKTDSALGNKIKKVQALDKIEKLLQSEEMKTIFDELPSFRITFDTDKKTYEVQHIRGKHEHDSTDSSGD